MDLEDNSGSIHREIKQLMDHSQKIQKDVGVFGLEGLTNWLGLGGWFKGIIQSLLMILIIVVLGLVMFSCVVSCIKRIVMQTTNNILLAQNKNGGIVEEWLAERGHFDIEKLSHQDLKKYRKQLV